MARGATVDARVLVEQIQRVPGFRHEVAPMHGDLHAENIQVRGTDAILIDFARVRRRGPLVADPACLEASLVFGVWGEQGKDKNAGWHELVDRLYSLENLRRPPPPAIEPLPREWLWNAVRQIRLIAFGAQLDFREYRLALAICLLREARFSLPASAVAEEARKAYAYVIAERLVRDLGTP